MYEKGFVLPLFQVNLFDLIFNERLLTMKVQHFFHLFIDKSNYWHSREEQLYLNPKTLITAFFLKKMLSYELKMEINP